MIKSNMSVNEIASAGAIKDGPVTRVLNSFYLITDPEDQHVSKMCRDSGFWEPDVTSWMTKNIKPGWNCLDIGSNIGYFTEVLSRLVGESGSVTAFEPNKKLVDEYNVVRKINNYDGCGKIIVMPWGVGESDKHTMLSVPLINIGGAAISEGEEKEGYELKEVSLISLDENNIINKNIDFIKMDIEGYEPNAMNGMKNILETCSLLLLELGPYHPEDFLKDLNEKYFMYRINGDNEINISYNDILSAPHHWNVVLKKRLVDNEEI